MERDIEAFLELKNLIERMNIEVPYAIVEGKKDKEALEKIGYKGKIFYANRLKTPKEKIVILTDFDEEGMEMAKRITRRVGEKNVDKFFRNEFKKILKSIRRYDIQSIVNLCKKYEKLIY